MKLFFISDIHGSLYYLKKALEAYEREEADYIVILGDALYHGPRNALPKDYDPKEVAKVLNQYQQKIIAVRGNCDSEVDQMMIDYPMMGEYAIVFYENKKLFLTHGHIYHKNNLPKLSKGDVLIHGHTHIPVLEKLDDFYLFNPGSISLPKENNPPTYGILKNKKIQIKDLDFNVISSMDI
ncbi:phosphodiesterase [Inediibacterium massiliense]|uniref:phosphodiesterase n=1 Tax=Inediibacterium massiliense TaxID=1658111 RepID=UPI0006B66D54|nr:phosphodiesterase [Inediibacterium massiliense]